MKNTKNSPVISVVIPAYNEEKLIEKCLVALKKQDAKFSYEIIVVNGPSTDQTRAIAQEYADVVVNQTGIGIGQARNQGCKLAQGEILVMTDADVFAPPNWLTRIYDFFRENKYVIALAGPYNFIDADTLNRASRIVRPIAKEIHKAITGTIPFSGTNMAIRKDAYFMAGEFDPEITGLEDIELGMRLAKVGKSVYLENLVVKTTDRRFKHPTRHFMTTLLPAYIKRTVFKTKDDKAIWKPVQVSK
ncbi:glycosyltransferase family 2 protein [Patescibacteria group bacterium]|nr:glycosyltransferase family 2 protein [Patescibacteria group bacterium]MBU1967380.1 glycosyltransferase family 2 protein [Patescibacteria group bacterium]